MRPRLNIIGLVFVLLVMLLSGCAQTSGGSTTTAPPTADTVSVSSTTTSEPAPEPTTTTTELSDAQRLLQNMTLTEKAAQVMLIAFDGTSPSPDLQTFIADHPPGGVLLLERNVTSAAQLRRLTTEMQEAARQVSSVGLLVAVDQEGGTVQRIKYQVPDVPSARSLGRLSTPAEAAALAIKTATGLLSLGVNMNLAPVADVADKTSFLYPRTYGSEPAVVSAFVTAVVIAYEEAGLISTVKHFPGHGSAQGNTHTSAVVSDASLQDFDAIHLPPFRAAVSTGVEAVMIAHVIVNAYDPDHPASSSSILIEDLLRGDLGFRGLVLTDDIEMAGAGDASDKAQSAKQPVAGAAAFAVDALRAGCDLLVSTGTLADQQQAIDAITAAVKNGSLEQSRLDEAVLRILEAKLRHGIAIAM